MKSFLLAVVAVCLIFNGVAQGAVSGEKIYLKKCKRCHKLTDHTLVGPGLAGITERRTVEWLDKWLTNPKEMIKSGDPVALELKKKYGNKMPRIRKMKIPENRKAIIEFLKENDSKH